MRAYGTCRGFVHHCEQPLAHPDPPSLRDRHFGSKELRADGSGRVAPVMKTCTGCGRLLPLDDFRRDRHARDGHRSRCRACAVAAERVRRERRKARERGEAQ